MILQKRLKRHGQGGRRKTRRVRCPRANEKGIFQEDRKPEVFQIRWQQWGLRTGHWACPCGDHWWPWPASFWWNDWFKMREWEMRKCRWQVDNNFHCPWWHLAMRMISSHPYSNPMRWAIIIYRKENWGSEVLENLCSPLTEKKCQKPKLRASQKIFPFKEGFFPAFHLAPTFVWSFLMFKGPSPPASPREFCLVRWRDAQ